MFWTKILHLLDAIFYLDDLASQKLLLRLSKLLAFENGVEDELSDKGVCLKTRGSCPWACAYRSDSAEYISCYIILPKTFDRNDCNNITVEADKVRNKILHRPSNYYPEISFKGKQCSIGNKHEQYSKPRTLIEDMQRQCAGYPSTDHRSEQCSELRTLKLLLYAILAFRTIQGFTDKTLIHKTNNHIVPYLPTSFFHQSRSSVIVFLQRKLDLLIFNIGDKVTISETKYKTILKTQYTAKRIAGEIPETNTQFQAYCFNLSAVPWNTRSISKTYTWKIFMNQHTVDENEIKATNTDSQITCENKLFIAQITGIIRTREPYIVPLQKKYCDCIVSLMKAQTSKESPEKHLQHEQKTYERKTCTIENSDDRSQTRTRTIEISSMKHEKKSLKHPVFIEDSFDRILRYYTTPVQRSHEVPPPELIVFPCNDKTPNNKKLDTRAERRQNNELPQNQTDCPTHLSDTASQQTLHNIAANSVNESLYEDNVSLCNNNSLTMNEENKKSHSNDSVVPEQHQDTNQHSLSSFVPSSSFVLTSTAGSTTTTTEQIPVPTNTEQTTLYEATASDTHVTRANSTPQTAYRNQATIMTSTESRSIVGHHSQSTTNDERSFVPIVDKLADGERVAPQDSMKYEMLRFCTLRSFPKENKPFITRIAQAGFYYANNGDEVICYCCGKRKSSWRESDSPLDVHRQLNSSCSFLVRNQEVNVPVRSDFDPSSSDSNSTGTGSSFADASGEGSLSSLNQSQISHSEKASSIGNSKESTVAYTSKLMKNNDAFAPNRTCAMQYNAASKSKQIVQQNSCSAALRGMSNAAGDVLHNQASGHFIHYDRSQDRNNSSNGDIQPLVVDPSASVPRANPPKYPNYEDRLKRIESFKDCREIAVSKEETAEAGFFYAGFGDCVRCFQCGVGLRHWSEEDNPWIEHSRWSKDCSYVRAVKGAEFVQLVQMAVQYSQNLDANENGQTGEVSREEQRKIAEIEQLFLSVGAQSVLEMGYLPDVIRRAIKRVLETRGRDAVCAESIMGEIFEIEESERQAAEREREQAQLVGAAAASNTEPSKDSKSATQKKPINPKQLKAENELLKQQSICSVCKKKNVCIVFLPCGHLVTCDDCAPKVKYCNVQKCGKYIKGTVRTYLS